MILQANLNHFNVLVIGLSIQTLNNRLVDRYGKIKAIQKVKSFLLVGNKDFIDINSQSNSYFFVTNLIFRHVRQDLIDITKSARKRHKIHCMGLNLKSRFLESIKRENKEFKGIIKKEPDARIKQIPPISGIKLKDYFLFDLASFSRQVAITQAEKLVLSFLACSSICSINSWGKRIAFLSDLLFLLPVAIFKPKRCSLVCKHYTRSLNNKKVLTCVHTMKYSEHTPNKFIGLKKQSPDVLATLSRDLTTNIIRSNAMANSNDTLRPENGQPDLSCLFSVLNLYKSDIPVEHLSQAEDHFEELQQSILWGIGAIGNLMFWACENEDYTEQSLKNDMRDLGYLFIQLRDLACFATNQMNLLNTKLSNKGGK